MGKDTDDDGGVDSDGDGVPVSDSNQLHRRMIGCTTTYEMDLVFYLD